VHHDTIVFNFIDVLLRLKKMDILHHEIAKGRIDIEN